MSLDLDPRQRAMLEAMGVKLWQPLAPAEMPVSAQAHVQAMPEKRAAEAVKPMGQNEPKVSVPSTARFTPPPATAPATALTSSPRPADELAQIATLDWPALTQAVSVCQACDLCQSRKQAVFGQGDPQAHWLVVGEAPGEHEDLQGQPFVGPAGQLLDNMLKAVGLTRTGTGEQGAFITNALKCRPPANRNPQPAEVAQCEPYLRRQVALQQPKIILALGRVAAQALLQASLPEVATLPLGKLRGQVHQYQGVPVVVSYHPAYLLRAPHDKAKAWADLCLALDVLQKR